MTVEATLPHGLRTSLYGSEYKAEYDANLALLDPDRITSGTLAGRPAAGAAKRFYYATDQNTLYYDDGTVWTQQIAPAAAAHAATHASGGSDAISLAQSQVTDLTADLAAKEAATNKGAANGYAPLDASSKVPVTHIPPLPQSQINNLESNLAGKELAANKGVANGYAPLDASGKVPIAYQCPTPSFSAYLSTDQSIPANAFTKIQFNVENWDNNNNYDNAANFRFTPTVPGKYLFVISAMYISMTVGDGTELYIFKNGGVAKRVYAGASKDNCVIACVCILTSNGATDYFEGYAYQSNAAAKTVQGYFANTYFEAQYLGA
ncbi:MAG: hypothetical protein HZA04_06085 [Nitrospinae bacterium]|nr:hypothetical protein [Nitrospinota bacterium]